MRLWRVIFAQSASDMLPQSGNVKVENRSDFRFYWIREIDKSESEGFQIKKTNKFSKTIYLSRYAGRSFYRTACLRERVKVSRYIASKFAAEQILKVKFPIKMTNAMKAFGRAREPFRKRVLE